GFELYCQLLKQSVSALKGEKVKPRVEVQVRLDFLALSPGEEGPKSKVQSPKSGASVVSGQWSVANATDHGPLTTDRHATRNTEHAPAAAYIPFNYISDARQRIEIYRKLAQATD